MPQPSNPTVGHNPHLTRKRRMKQLRYMLYRRREILSEKQAAGKATAPMIQAFEAEIKALEWALNELGDKPCAT